MRWLFLRRPKPATAPKLPVPLEKDVQRSAVELYEKVGCEVYNLSQPRATLQTPGLPDLLVFHSPTGSFWLHEVKRPGGKLRPAQIIFQGLCKLCGVAYIVGGVEVAADHVVKIKAAHRLVGVRR